MAPTFIKVWGQFENGNRLQQQFFQNKQSILVVVTVFAANGT